MKIIQFSKYERAVLLFFALIVALIAFWPRISDSIFNQSDPKINGVAENGLMGEIVETNDIISTNLKNYEKTDFEAHNKKDIKRSRFEFDPNNISKDSLLLLGVKPGTAKNWVKYLEKGGRFREPKEVNKIFGMTQHTYDILKDQMIIKKRINIKKKIPKQLKERNETYNIPDNTVFELNNVSAEELMQLPGIGEVFSTRIIKYRNSLGGFLYVEQLKEVYGLSEETFEAIRERVNIDSSLLIQLKINEVKFRDLLKHPYCDYELTKMLINFREQHGPYRSKQDINKILTINKEKITHLLPYLSFALQDSIIQDSLTGKTSPVKAD